MKETKIHDISAISFTLTLFLGVITCLICDRAISKEFTWSLIVTYSAIFTWVVFFPIAGWLNKGILASLILLTLLCIPYFYLLDSLIDATNMIFPIALKMNIIGIVYLWAIFIVFSILKNRIILPLAISLILAIPASLLVNWSLSSIINEPLIDIWDIMSMLIVLVIAIVLLCLIKKRR